jgi:hypothetical protein
MLNQLLALFEGRSNALSLDEISRELQAQPSAVLGMLDVLVGHGRLAEIGPDGGYCAACGLQAQCSLLVARRKRYALALRNGAATATSAPNAETCLMAAAGDSAIIDGPADTIANLGKLHISSEP